MNRYWAFSSIAFKNAFAYRTATFLSIFGSVFSILAQIAIWHYIFRNDAGMIRYMMAYVIIAQIISIFLNNNISTRIGDKVTSGEFAVDLLKPVDPTLSFFSTSLGTTLAQLVNRGLIVIIAFSPFLVRMDLEVIRILLAAAVSIIGYLMASIIFLIIGYLSIRVFEIWPYSRLMNDTIRLFAGGVIPLVFFPDWLATISNFLPFHLLYSFPIRLILGDISQTEIYQYGLLMIGWTLLLYGLLRFTYRKVIQHTVIQGG
jgi:ABC-2 type transport system permease protein